MMTIRRYPYAFRSPVRLFLALIAATVLVASRGPGPLGLLQAEDNPIPAENSLPGDTDWDISGSGEASIQGFASDMSVNVGGTIDFKIDTPSTDYRIDIYRLGYYGGLGARRVETVQPSATLPQGQPSCALEAASGLVDCGTWAVSASWAVPVGAVSGIYIAKPTREDGEFIGAASHIVFIVRDDSRPADVLMQTSDTTWQAYNKYGGANLYCGGPVANTAAYARSCDGRATKVSYNRPFDTRGHSPQSFLFNADYPMLRFLEANGYNVKYWSGVDSDRYGDALAAAATRPQVFVSVGHDEYWSGNQRTAVENARNAGVNLAFFSGNEVYWKTRWEPSIAGTPAGHRTLVSYKDTLAGIKLDPLANVTTGTWRDTRFAGGRPENALIGTIWTVNNGTSAITVPASMAGMRLWRNTRVADLTTGSTTLAPGSLGYEWGEDLDNGFRPAGLFHLSSTTVNNVEKIVDFGANVGMGTATHHLTLYRHGSALVFGASTVQWAWGLDSAHDDNQFGPLSHTPDKAMQQATVNLLADMGAQPSSLRVGDGLVSASQTNDSIPPTSTITSPLSGRLESGSPVVISGTANDLNGEVAGVEVSVDGGTTWRAAQGRTAWSFNWVPGTPGSVTIRSRAVDDSGNLETADVGVTVSVVTCTYPCASLFRPTQVPTNLDAGPATLELGVRFKSDIDGFITGVRFYKAPANIGTAAIPHTGSLWSASGTRLATATFTGGTSSGWQEVSFDSPVAILANTTYVASYFAPFGHYSYDRLYFDNRVVDAPPLHTLPGDGNALTGGNGVYFNGGSGFPTSSFQATNYWVDVVFTPSLQDAIPPVISSIKAATIDSSRVTITWLTNEDAKTRLDYGTDPNILTDTNLPPGTLSVTNNTFATQHRVALTGLQANATYYYRITAIDRSANQTVALPPTFTVPGPTLRDTASSDFAAGTGTGTYVSETGDGEVILLPAVGAEFSGPTLPAGWVAVPWSTAGYSKIENGVLLVDGARVATCQTDATTGLCRTETSGSTPSAAFTAAHSLDFSARFSGSSFQHAGFGVTFDTTSEPWAIFSVMPTQTGAVELFARTNLNNGAGFGITSLGTSLLGAFHRYRIDWNVSSVDYYVDGTLVAQHALTVAGPMRPVAASDFDDAGGTVFVDWMRMSPNTNPGTFVSRVFDANAVVDWKTIQWAAKTPAGTTLVVSVRTGDTPTPPQTPDGTWSPFAAVASAGPLSLRSQYIQYRVDMTTTEPAMTAELADLIISTGNGPVATSDFAALRKNSTHTFPPSGLGSLTYNDTDADVNDTLGVATVTQPSHGTAVVNGDGSVVYTPVANYFGADAFTYTVTDGLLTASATVTIDVRDGNVPPVSSDDFFEVNEGVTLTVPAPGILLNDTDVDRNALTAVLVSFPRHGMVTFPATGAFTYTPAPNYAGPDAFTYQAHDGMDGSTLVATVHILVKQVNDPPFTVADSFNAMLNQPLDVPAPGVLANDRDVEVEDTAPLHAQLVSPVAHGQLTLNSDGSFSYVPEADFLGTDSFTYSAVDHFGAVGAPTTVTLTVAIKSVTQSIAGGTVSTGTGVNAGDPLNTAVTTSIPAIVKIAQGAISGSTSPAGFTFLNQQVNITLTSPTTGLEVTATNADPLVFTFEIDMSLIPPGQTAQTFQMFRNGVVVPNCLEATSIPTGMDPCVSARSDGTRVKLTVLTTRASHWNMGLGTPPDTDNLFAINDPTYVTNYQTPLEVRANFGVSMNDVGPGHLIVTLDPTLAPYGGLVDLKESGAFDFTPNPGFCGVATFTYQLRTDIAAVTAVPASDTGTASIRVNCVPVAGDDPATVLEDSGLTLIDVRFNDSDPDNQALAITAVTDAAHGTVVIGGTVPTTTGGAWLSYQPNANFFGSDSFTYTIKDTGGDTATGTVNITVTPVNDAPSFVLNSDQTVAEDAGPQAVHGVATAMSAGPANENAQALSFIIDNTNTALFSAQPAVDADGVLTYTPAANGYGSATVTLRIRDDGGVGDGGVDTSAPLTFVITVKPVNDDPIANTDSVTIVEDSGVNAIDVRANDNFGPDADETLTVNAVTQGSYGVVAVTATGVSYTPNANYFGSDNFTYTIDDGNGRSATAMVNLTVTPVNDNPVANTDSATLAEDSGVNAIDVRANDTLGPDVEETLTVIAVTQGANGVVTFTAAGVSYAPNANYNGPDSFTYTINDGNGGSATATVNVSVTMVNDDPVANTDSVTVAEDSGANTIDVRANDNLGPDANETLTVNAVTQGANGTVAVTATGVSYAPKANYFGPDSFTYTIDDGNGGGATATVNVMVTNVNDDPVANTDSTTVAEDSGVTNIAVRTNDTLGPDVGETLTVTAVTAAAHGTAAVTATGVSYAPSANYVGPDSFSYTITDGNGGNATATVTVTVTPVNDNPVANADSATVAEDSGATNIAVRNNDTIGPDAGETLTVTAVSAAGHGTAAVTASGVSYAPAADYFGPDSFTYTISDGNGGSATATVSVTVTQIIPTATSRPTTSLTPAAYGTNLTFTTTVTSAGGTPTGLVEFFDGIVSLGTAPLNAGGTASKTTNAVAAGTRAITAKYLGDSRFAASTSLPLTQTVTGVTAAVTTTFTASPLTPQYSDQMTFNASVSPATVNGQPAARVALFKVGAQVVGTAPLTLNTTTGKLEATLNAPLVETTAGAMRPGIKTAAVEFVEVAPGYTIANRTASTTVKAEDALTAYTGPAEVLTATGAATIRLETKVWELADGNPGDVRTATVAFVNRTTGATIGAAILDTAKSTPTVAYYYYNYAVNIGASASQTFTIGTFVNGYYTRNATADNGTTIVKKP